MPTLHRYLLEKPQTWKAPRTVFVGSMCDLFGEWVPDEWIESVFEACAAAPQHRYLFLTKNPNRYVSLCEKGLLPLEHWYGITRDSKKAASRRIYSTNHKFFASYEPLLEDIGDCGCFPWIIIGAETGNRRGKVKTELAWVDNLVTCMSVRNNYTKIFMKDSLVPIVGEKNMLREFPWVGKYEPREPWICRD
jgi:protein gp37